MYAYISEISDLNMLHFWSLKSVTQNCNLI